MNWSFELTRPIFLTMLLILPLFWWGYRRSLAAFPQRQMIVSLATRSVIVLFLILALAGLTLLSPTQQKQVLFLIDTSRSIGEKARESIVSFLEDAQGESGDHRISFLPFALHPKEEQGEMHPEQWFAEASGRPEEPSPQSDPSDSEKTPPAGKESPPKMSPRNDPDLGTNFTAAIRQGAASLLPDHIPELVLLTDGNETHQEGLFAAVEVGVPVSTVVLPVREEPEVQMADLALPPQVREGEPFYLEIEVHATRATTATISLFRGSFSLVEEKKELKAGSNRFRYRQSVEDQRLAEFSAQVSAPDDTFLDNNRSAGLVSIAGKPRVLLIEEDPGSVRQFRWAMQQQNLEIEVRPPEGIPDSLSDLQNHDLVILSDVPATRLTQQQMETMRTYVRDLGGGLLMLGGKSSFGLGGYYKTPIEEILPVRCDFEKEKDSPSLAMALVIDKSGSMQGMKMEMAKDAAKAAVELLNPRDMISLIAFDGEATVLCPIHGAMLGGTVENAIASLQAGGGTNIYPALKQAYDQLVSTSAKLKHVILLTDGHSQPGDFLAIAQRMSSMQITLSTVGIGDGADHALLQNLAQTGSGRSYRCEDPQMIPQVFAKETMEANQSTIKEVPFLPQVITPSPVTGSIAFDAAPPLLGYVKTRVKPTSQFILATDSGDPLLAWWRYGLGHSAAFTSDVKSRWSAEWLGWSDFSILWAQVVRHLMRSSDQELTRVMMHPRDQQAEILIDAVDHQGNFIHGCQTKMTVIPPGLEKEVVSCEEVAPGRYRATFPTDRQGAYHVHYQFSRKGRPLLSGSRGMVVGYPEELRVRPANEALLKAIATVSGGRINPTPAELFVEDGRFAHRSLPLWSHLLVAALLLFLFDVALRRLEMLPGASHTEKISTKIRRKGAA